jgi:succinate dehydrogenase / fumarate reductase flavoprotein subunit
LLRPNGKRDADHFHRRLGAIVWEECGMARSKGGLEKAIGDIAALRDEFNQDLRVLGSGAEFNQGLERAGRVADFFELADLMCRDALDREESCGGHFRLEHQASDGEAMRNDQDYQYVAAWEFTGVGSAPRLHKEKLEFEYVKPSQRSYK